MYTSTPPHNHVQYLTREHLCIICTHTHKYIGTTVLWCDTITTTSHVSALYNCTAQEYTALSHTVIYTEQQDYWALNTAVTSLGYSTIPSVNLLQLFEEDQTAEEDLQIETSCNLIKWLLCSKLNNLVLIVHLPHTAMNPYSVSCTYTLVSKHTQVVVIGSVCAATVKYTSTVLHLLSDAYYMAHSDS